MTVTYSRRVADAGLGTFFHLLLRWRGSIYKLLYRELIIFSLLYSFFSIVYRSESLNSLKDRWISPPPQLIKPVLSHFTSAIKFNSAKNLIR